MKNKIYIFFILITVLIFLSCTSSPKIKMNNFLQMPDSEAQKEKEEIEYQLTMFFAGDIMAHKPNYSMKDYNKIWKSIKPDIKSSDFSFANIEAPVDNNLPYSTYPDFNMHSEYPQAAIDAGFNVFSIVNNHTNDQGLEGMHATRKWALNKEVEISNRAVYFSGLNENSGDPLSYKIIRKENWTIIFCAVTEILNRPDHKSFMNYVSFTESGRKAFLNFISSVRENNPCDLFIISIHTDEPEYVFEVKDIRREYYKNLIESGVDIIWANHPHIIREREIIGKNNTGKLTKVIMYGNGNTISAQRHKPSFDAPYTKRDDTGDGLIFKIVYSKKENTLPFIKETKPIYITTYINNENEFLIKKLDSNFIKYLEENGQTKWSSYLEKRKANAEKTKETIIWQ